MEEKGLGVCRRIRRESPNNIKGLFLKHTEGTFGKCAKQKFFVAPEREVGRFNLLDIGKTEQPIIACLRIHAVGDKVMPVAVKKSIWAHELSAEPASASRSIVEVDLAASEDRMTQIREDPSRNQRTWARPKRGPFRLCESFEVRFNAAGSFWPNK